MYPLVAPAAQFIPPTSSFFYLLYEISVHNPNLCFTYVLNQLKLFTETPAIANCIIPQKSLLILTKLNCNLFYLIRSPQVVVIKQLTSTSFSVAQLTYYGQQLLQSLCRTDFAFLHGYLQCFRYTKGDSRTFEKLSLTRLQDQTKLFNSSGCEPRDALQLADIKLIQTGWAAAIPRSVETSAPTSLQPRVRIPCTTSMFFNLCCSNYICHLNWNVKK